MSDKYVSEIMGLDFKSSKSLNEKELVDEKLRQEMDEYYKELDEFAKESEEYYKRSYLERENIDESKEYPDYVAKEIGENRDAPNKHKVHEDLGFDDAPEDVAYNNKEDYEV